MPGRAVISLGTGLEDSEKVTVAFLVAVGAAEAGRPTLMFLTYYVCPICFNAKQPDQDGLIAGAEIQGTVPMWNWIGDEPATTFSY